MKMVYYGDQPTTQARGDCDNFINPYTKVAKDRKKKERSSKIATNAGPVSQQVTQVGKSIEIKTSEEACNADTMGSHVYY